jgi:hypothetical protein
MATPQWIIYLAPWASPAVSAISAGLSYFFYRRTSTLNRTLSDRSVRMEAQKMLLEFNKQLIADSALWAIFDADQEGFEIKLKEKEFQLKLRAVGNLVLNMFDLTLSQIPAGPERDAWLNYFKDVVARSTILVQILKDHEDRAVYTTEFLEVWKEVRNSTLNMN